MSWCPILFFSILIGEGGVQARVCDGRGTCDMETPHKMMLVKRQKQNLMIKKSCVNFDEVSERCLGGKATSCFAEHLATWAEYGLSVAASFKPPLSIPATAWAAYKAHETGENNEKWVADVELGMECLEFQVDTLSAEIDALQEDFKTFKAKVLEWHVVHVKDDIMSPIHNYLHDMKALSQNGLHCMQLMKCAAEIKWVNKAVVIPAGMTQWYDESDCERHFEKKTNHKKVKNCNAHQFQEDFHGSDKWNFLENIEIHKRVEALLVALKEDGVELLHEAASTVVQGYTAVISEFLATASSVQDWATALCYPFANGEMPPKTTDDQWSACDRSEEDDVESGMKKFQSAATIFINHTQAVLDWIDNDNFRGHMMHLRDEHKGHIKSFQNYYVNYSGRIDENFNQNICADAFSLIKSVCPPLNSWRDNEVKAFTKLNYGKKENCGWYPTGFGRKEEFCVWTTDIHYAESTECLCLYPPLAPEIGALRQTQELAKTGAKQLKLPPYLSQVGRPTNPSNLSMTFRKLTNITKCRCTNKGNEIECNDGETQECPSHQDCSAEKPFVKGQWEEGCS